MGLVESAQMAQDWYLHKEEMTFAKKAFALDRRALNVDLVNTIREDLRDLCSQRYGRIDNLMVVNTLVLSFSFGFCCEGTFPEAEYYREEHFFMCIYALFMGLTLVFPFWSIWYALECKNCLDSFLSRVLNEDREKRMDVRTWLNHYVGFEHFWLDKCQDYYRFSQNFFWCGMLCSILLCAILSGLNFYQWYHPSVWIIFTAIVCGNVFLVTCILMFRSCRWFCYGRKQKKHRATNQIDVSNLINAMEKSSKDLLENNGQNTNVIKGLQSPLLSGSGMSSNREILTSFGDEHDFSD